MYGGDFSVPRMPSFNFDAMHESIQESMEERFGYARVMFEGLSGEIKKFQSQLKPDEEIGAYLASFGREIYLSIETMSYKDPYLIIFSGTTGEGREARLVHHVSQINVLFEVRKVRPEENRKPYRIGLHH